MCTGTTKVPNLHTHTYLWPKVLEVLKQKISTGTLLDAGCGNGAFCQRIKGEIPELEVFGLDLEESGIIQARRDIPQCRFELYSVYDDLTIPFSTSFDVVVSLEVVEHLLTPRRFVDRIYECLKPGGTFIISTPYHGYCKNLALAIAGKFDDHFTALWEGGHIKFWSRKTLTTLLERAGFHVSAFYGAGRFYPFWKSMILVATKN